MKDKIKEWYKNNKNNIKRYLSYLVLFIIMVVLAIPFVIDLNRIDISKVPLLGHIVTPFLIDNEKIADIMNTLFSVQASVSTLGIALISILGGICKDTVFGISVTRYITQMKPAILTHKFLVISELALIILGYVALSIGYYNWLIAIFFVSIVMTIYMVKDIFFIFKGEKAIKHSVKGYCLGLFKNYSENENILNNKFDIISDITYGAELLSKQSNSINIEDYLDCLQSIFTEIINNPKINNEDNLLRNYEMKIRNMFYNVFEKLDSNSIVSTIVFLTEIHKECNNINTEEKYIYLNIYDYIYEELFKSFNKIKSCDYKDLLKKLQHLKFELYENMFFIKEEKENNFKQLVNNRHLIHFSNDIYNYSNDKFNLEQIYVNMVNLLFTNDKSKFEINKKCKKCKYRMMIIEFHIYAINLINNGETDLLFHQLNLFLNDEIIYKLKENNKDNKVIWFQYYFNIIAHTYYSNKINIDDLPTIKVFLDYIIKSDENEYTNSLDILDCYIAIKRSNWNEDFLLLINICKFIIYLVLFNEDNTDNIINKIKKSVEIVIKNDSIYVKRFDKEIINNSKAQQEYKDFVKLFFDEEVTDKKAEEKLQMLQQACEEIQKDDNKSDSIQT